MYTETNVTLIIYTMCLFFTFQNQHIVNRNFANLDLKHRLRLEFADCGGILPLLGRCFPFCLDLRLQVRKILLLSFRLNPSL